jgi:hypothetical protein
MEVLKRCGARCSCCGATSADGVRIHVDHIKPRKYFPHLALAPSNLQVLCEVCNHGKGNWDQTDWRRKPSAVTVDIEVARFERGATFTDLEEWQRNHLREICNELDAHPHECGANFLADLEEWQRNHLRDICEMRARA